MCESVWNQYEFPQMNLQAVCITCAFSLSSESSYFTFFLHVSVLPTALQSWLSWSRLMVSVPRKGSWVLWRQKKFFWTYCEELLVCLGNIICHCFFCFETLYSLLFFFFSLRGDTSKSIRVFSSSEAQNVSLPGFRQFTAEYSEHKIRLKLHFRNFHKLLQPNTVKSGV